MNELKTLYTNSKESVDVKLLIDSSDDDDIKILTTIQNNETGDRKKIKTEDETSDVKINNEKNDSIVKNRNLKVKKEKETLISENRLKEIDNLFENSNSSDYKDENNTSIKNKRKQNETQTNNQSPIKKIKHDDLKCDGIFTNTIIFVIPEAKENVEKYLNPFKEQGGKITENSLSCTHAIHKEGFISEDLKSLRFVYLCMCVSVIY